MRVAISHLPDSTDHLNRARRLEWLETNGIGGFASSTALGIHTRRYHGLLVAALHPPVGRVLMLSKFEETLVLGDARYELSANQYPGAVHPQGFQYLAEFCQEPFPTYVYRVDGVEVRKSVFLRHGENTVCVEYSVSGDVGEGGRPCHLELRPLLAFRDYHSTTHRNEALRPDVEGSGNVLTMKPYSDLPPLFLGNNAREWRSTGDWYFRLQYDVERERGLDFEEDLFNPIELLFDLAPQRPARLIASTERCDVDSFDSLREQELLRRERLLESAHGHTTFVRQLTAAADQFIVSRGAERSVIAGYPWFADWGRDTMIALPGLTLSTGRPEIAARILKTFAANVSEGMLPNRFPDAGESPEYNTVDATLWFFEAVRAYLENTGDYSFVRAEVYPALREIVDWHIRGTRFGICVDDDGLLRCGSPGVQLTWMDAKVGDWVVTPRYGKPVEIQSLWYNALRIMEDLAERFRDAAEQRRAAQFAQRAIISFRPSFWNPEAGCLYDVVDGGAPDASIRPNQIFAVSLPYSMLGNDDARAVVRVVERELLTPMGLRSLAPSDPQYRPVYRGGVVERDGAYHQGTVWPWLLGPFIDAWMRVHGDTSVTRGQVAAWMRGIECHLRDACIGQISEIADAEEPHLSRGCPAQAWSVSELLRVAKAYAVEVAEEPAKEARTKAERAAVAAGG